MEKSKKVLLEEYGMEKSKKVLLEVCGVLVFVAVICVVIVHNRTSVAAVLEENYHNGTYRGWMDILLR